MASKPARRTTTVHLINPSKLACFSLPGRSPMLVYVRSSKEALLIVKQWHQRLWEN